MYLTPICHYYQLGTCRNGENCAFLHPVVECEAFSALGWCTYGTHCHFWHNPAKTSRAKLQPCQFYLMGACKYGDRCNLSHDVELSESSGRTLLEYQQARYKRTGVSMPYRQPTSVSLSLASPSDPFVAGLADEPEELPPRPPSPRLAPPENVATNPSIVAHQPCTRPINKALYVCLNNPDPEHIDDLQSSEVERLVKANPPSRLREEFSHDGKLFILKFSSSDPDWAFDVKEINLKILLPHKYPVEPAKVVVLDQASLPQQLIVHLNESIVQWIEKKQAESFRVNRAEAYLRPLLFWLDRNLEEMFEEGLAKMRANPIVIRDERPDAADVDNQPQQSVSAATPEDYSSTIQPVSNGNDQQVDDLVDQVQALTSSDRPDTVPTTSETRQNKATHSVRLSDMHLLGKTGCFLIRKLYLAMHCTRCRFPFEWAFRLHGDVFKSGAEQHRQLESLPPHSDACGKCSQRLHLHFTACLAHVMENRIGWLTLAGCAPDYVQSKQSEGALICVECNLAAKVVPLHPSMSINKRCFDCHSILGIEFSNFLMQQINEPDRSSNEKTGIPSASRKTTLLNPPLQEGAPLPHRGTCKHYQHSHRWLKFPCCGRLAPCDICHDEMASDKHEMEFANRMVCGFCSKEQPYSNSRPCMKCGKTLTTVRSSHWEGGKGCRNKTTMSRKDAKKYTDASKTTSRSGNKS